MRSLPRLALIGNSLPRRCGIATFTTDLQQALADGLPKGSTSIIAMNDGDRNYNYPPTVEFEVRADSLRDYVDAAKFINRGSFDVVSLQHEFGIFGGDTGAHILALLDRLTVPVVTTLHTVLTDPNAAQRRVFSRIIAASARVIVMAEMGRKLLIERYQIDPGKIEVIAHGIPDFDFVEPDAAKAALGFADKTVILTFGLLSPNKGIEVMIDAMSAVLAVKPDAVYVVLGATHPNLVREQGECYRESLVARAAALGIADRVIFLDQFVDRPTLLQHISMCDIYVTPYLNREQMTSGTLAYSFGLGKAVVSTPYWHAVELLADGRGCLVPFGDAAATGSAIAGLLADEPRRQAMRRRAFKASRSMTWEETADRYLATFESVRSMAVGPVVGAGTAQATRSTPSIGLGHLEVMTDDTGLLQHALFTVPDRRHGYCVDDNARALLLTTMLAKLGEQQIGETITSRYAAFVQHAWNADIKRFRNFMSFERSWLEEQGSEDSHGRTLWALGATARHDENRSRRRWAEQLFSDAYAIAESFDSPRAATFTLLGLHNYCAAVSDPAASALRLRLADRLLVLFQQVETPNWVWFEEGLAYDNARLCEAMILTGKATGVGAYLDTGLRALGWLLERQTSASGLFQPVGTEGFADVREVPRAFDQQPVEAAATIAACVAAYGATGESKWEPAAGHAFSWFLGKNDLGEPLVDVETGSCRDGLHPDRRNENCGAESVLSYLLSLADIRRLDRMNATRAGIRAPTREPTTPHSLRQPRGRLAASQVSQPPSTLPSA
ncbi:MAG: glycosyltransferase family 4 protein [Devosia sp.]